jgi:N-acetylglucosamine-6-sulfatase
MTRSSRRSWLVASLTLGILLAPISPARAAATDRPNIVVIVTDDQRFDSMVAMPEIREAIGDHGITFHQAVVSNALCCPSRAALLLGAYSHTSGVYTNESGSGFGAWPAFVAAGSEERTIARALHEVGYRTALFGKYFNEFTGREAPVGWDRFAAFLDDPTDGRGDDGGAYYDYSLLVDGLRGPRIERYDDAPSEYSTHVIGAMAKRFVREAAGEQPFLLYLTPYAPHGRMIPAPRDVGTWGDHQATMRPGFNERDMRDKPSYLRQMPKYPVDRAREQVRRSYETLASVDRMVGDLVRLLAAEGVLGRTMIVFTSDNGLSRGEHRWNYKMTPHEESIRVPLLIRYDPLTSDRAGTATRALVANVDIVPTIAELAGIDYTGVGTVDGRSLVPLLRGESAAVRHEVLLEHLDVGSIHRVPTYCGLRTRRYVFVRYATGERELYDLARDPYELQNLAAVRPALARSFLERTVALCDPAPPRYAW